MKNQNQGIKRSVSLTSKKQTPTRRRKGHFHKFLVVFHVILIVTLGRQIRRQLQLLGHQQYHQYDAVVREGEGGIQFKRSTLAKMRSESGSRQSSETGISNKFVDVLSISSLVRPELSQAQKETWASHHTVRNFMTVSEHDDPDPKCSSNFDTGKVNAYIQGCVKHNRDTNPSLKNYYLKSFFATHYAKYKWLAQKGDAGGWLCAQRRVAVGLAKIGRSYREREEELPEYLILADDDMYVNMDMFEESILLQSNNTVGEVQEIGANRTAKVYAGCVIVAAPAHEHEFTFPWGGWGTFFNKGAIERLIMPLYCEDNHNKSPFEEWACGKLTGGGDFLGESSFFQEGMSISDLMGAFADVPRYCLHSDWGVGYFINVYAISGVQWDGPEAHIGWYPNSKGRNRIHPLGDQESFIYKTRRKFIRGNCKWDGDTCNQASLVCHFINNVQMEQLWKNRRAG